MRCFRRRWLAATLFTAWVVAAAPASGMAPLVDVTIEPSQIAMGDSAELRITSSGGAAEPVSLPEVSGLEFRVVGQSRRIEIINGATLVSSTFVVRVTPQAPGVYTIPGITPKSQPLVLRVNPEGTPAPPSAAGKFNGGSRPAGASAEGLRMTADGSAFVRLVLPKKEVYVGESVPVEIEVGMRAGFVSSLNGLPTLTGGDFTLNNLSHQPERVEKLIDGKPFTVLTWHSVIAAVKPGKFSLAVDTPLTVRVRTRSPRDSMMDDMLGDPFLQNFFGATVPKDVTVTSPTSELQVQPLPTEGRPPDFSGAVGSFKITGDLSSKSAAAGDPLTLRMHLTGAGNFDRVDSAMLEHLEDWKTYPPKSSFKAGDALGINGEKLFEQPLIASRPGEQTLPGLKFSYFDPGTRRYETARTAPLNVTIAPSLADRSQSTAPLAGTGPDGAPPNARANSGARANATDNANGTANAAGGGGGLHPDHVSAETPVDSLTPLYLQPRFLAVPSLLTLAFAGGWLALRRRAQDSLPDSRQRAPRTPKAVNRVLVDLEAAARADNPGMFFGIARQALLHNLAARWQLSPEQITPQEIDSRLGERGQDIRRLLALADEVDYSGTAVRSDFARWLAVVRDELMRDTSARGGITKKDRRS